MELPNVTLFWLMDRTLQYELPLQDADVLVMQAPTIVYAYGRKLMVNLRE